MFKYRYILIVFFLISPSVHAEDFPARKYSCLATAALHGAGVVFNLQRQSEVQWSGYDNIPKRRLLTAIRDCLTTARKEGDIKELEKAFEDAKYVDSATYGKSGFDEYGKVLLEYLRTVNEADKVYQKKIIKKGITTRQADNVLNDLEVAQRRALAKLGKGYKKIVGKNDWNKQYYTLSDLHETLSQYFTRFPNARYVSETSREWNTIKEKDIPMKSLN